MLPHLLTSYNTAKHSALHGATPSEIYNDKDAESQLRDLRLESDASNKSKPKLHIGDIVRVALTRKTFDRGYTPNWTHELYKIVGIDNTQPPPMYSVLHLESGEQIEGKFYHQNLQLVYK